MSKKEDKNLISIDGKKKLKLKHLVNALVQQEKVSTRPRVPAPFSDEEVSDMKEDYRKTIDKADSERRGLYAARSTTFLASFGVPALLGRYMNTDIDTFNAVGAASFFLIGAAISSVLSKKFRERQLRDVAVSQYAETKLKDLADKAFQQKHGHRIHGDIIEHLNNYIGFDSVPEDALQSASRNSFILAIGLAFCVNIAPVFLGGDDESDFDKIERLIDRSIEHFIDEYEDRFNSPETNDLIPTLRP